MKKLLTTLLLLSLGGCASLGGARHSGTVGLVSTHAVLSAIQDVEMGVVCGRVGAPQPPLCVAPLTHQKISALLVEAFDLEIKAANLTRGIPPGTPQSEDVIRLMVHLNILIQDILDLIPSSTQKKALVQNIGGAN